MRVPLLRTMDARPVLEAMSYRSGDQVCKNCIHFLHADISGNTDAREARCGLNRAFELAVDEIGTCSFFCKKQKEMT